MAFQSEIKTLSDLGAALRAAALAKDEPGFLALVDKITDREAISALLGTNPTTASDSAAGTGLASLLRRAPEPPKPEFFFGSQDKPPLVRTWLYQIEQYFRLWPTMTDGDKINHAVTLLRSHAMNWWQQMQSLARMGTVEEVCTFEQFKTAIEAQFGGFETTERARDLLASLRQVSSVENYVRRFREALLLLGDGNYLDADMRHRFVLGLKPWIQRVVRIEAPETLREAMELAERIGRVRVTGLDYGPSGSGNSAPRTVPPVPMEVDAITASSPNPSGRKKLTDREREYLRKNNGCFYCRKINAGHDSRNCPEKASNIRAQQ